MSQGEPRPPATPPLEDTGAQPAPEPPAGRRPANPLLTLLNCVAGEDS